MVVSCEQVWREISNYVDDDLDAALRSAMKEHFSSCQQCRAVLDGMHNVIRLYGDERMVELPSGFSRRMERRLTQTTAARSNVWIGWLVAAAAVILVAGSLRLAKSVTPEHPLKSEHAQPAKKIPPDMMVLVSADAKLFHVAGCSVIHNKDKVRSLTAKDAIAQGYVPCPRCLKEYINAASLRRGLVNSEVRIAAELEEGETRTAVPQN
jgi:Putative zinc-finger